MSSQISESAGLYSSLPINLSSYQAGKSQLDTSKLCVNSTISSEKEKNIPSLPYAVPLKTTNSISHDIGQVLQNGIYGKFDENVPSQSTSSPLIIHGSNIIHLPPYSDATISSHLIDPAKNVLFPPPHPQMNFGTPMSIPTPRLPTPRQRGTDRSQVEPLPQLASLLLATGLVGTARPAGDVDDQMGQQLSLKAAANLCRYKSELCRPFIEHGQCKYGDKCQFAHGRHEIRSMIRHPKYKTDLCKTYHTTGLCPYGPRCHFIHNDDERKLSDLNRQLIDQQRARLMQLQQRQQQQIQLSLQIRELQRRMAIADALAAVSKLSPGASCPDQSAALTSGLSLPSGTVDILRNSCQDMIPGAPGMPERSSLSNETISASFLALQNSDLRNLVAVNGTLDTIPRTVPFASSNCIANGQYVVSGKDLYHDPLLKRNGAMSDSELENITANLRNLQLQVKRLEEADLQMTRNGCCEHNSTVQAEFAGIENMQESINNILLSSRESFNAKIMPNNDAHLTASNSGYHHMSDRFVSTWNNELTAFSEKCQSDCPTVKGASVANGNETDFNPTRIEFSNGPSDNVIGETLNGETSRKLKSELRGNGNCPERLEFIKTPTDDNKSDQSSAGEFKSISLQHGANFMKTNFQGHNPEELFSHMSSHSSQKSSTTSGFSLPLTFPDSSSAGTRLPSSLSSSPSISSPSLSEVDTSSSHDRSTSEASVPDSFSTWTWTDHPSNWASSTTVGVGTGNYGWRNCLAPSNTGPIIQTAPGAASIRQPWFIY